jgi:hypothetical protein
MKESDIIHETENLALVKVKNGLEIHLQGNTHAICVGRPSMGIDRARETMEKMERDIHNLRRMYQLFS